MNTSLDISQDKSLLWLMAIACGLCAGANYYCQPLISSIQQYYQVPESQVALTVTFAQISYALGLLFIVPLGDMLNKSKLIPFLMLGAAVGLFICASAVNLPMLWIGTIIAGLFSVAAQILIPLATMAVKTGKNRRSGRFPDEWFAGRYSAFNQYCRITFRPVSLENDLCGQWHRHAGLKFLFKR